MQEKNDNVGKCGHVRCAGGNGCLQSGKAMRTYEEIKNDYLWNPHVCPSSLGEDGKPVTEGETAQRWDETTNPVECAECGAIKD